MIKPICQSVILLSLLYGIASGQDKPLSPHEKRTKADGFELPNFSIFGVSTVSKKFDKPFDSNELEQFLEEIKKQEGEDKTVKEERPYWIIPMIFYRSRSLFSKKSWTVKEIEEGQLISRFLARLTDKHDLKIEASDQEAFKEGLARLRDWFASMCQDNKTLASMIFTLDDGPFFGGEVDKNQVSGLKVVDSVFIPDRQASFVIMTSRGEFEPIIIGVQNEDKTIRWVKRFSGAPKGRISDAILQRPAVVRLEGYGYVLLLMADWKYGHERSHVYLDESLNLRFYYVSW